MDDYPLLDLFMTMLWFFLWILWFMLLFRILADLFRDDDLSGWGKAGWTILVCLLPFLGVLIYLVVRGGGMGRREFARLERQEQAFRSYVRDVAREGEPASGGSPTSVDELERLAGLRSQGDITDDEFERAKSQLLAAR